MNRREALGGAAAVMAAGAVSINSARADEGLPPISQEGIAMRGPAYEKDIFVIRVPGTLAETTREALKDQARKDLGDDVIVVILSDGLTMERIPAIPGRFSS